MSTDDELAFIKAVLAAFDRCDCHDSLFWRTPATGWATTALMATCSDTFYWASADAEDITPADLPLLQSCVDDLMAIDEGLYLPMLYACRKRKMRPMDQVFTDDHAAPLPCRSCCEQQVPSGPSTTRMPSGTARKGSTSEHPDRRCPP